MKHLLYYNMEGTAQWSEVSDSEHEAREVLNNMRIVAGCNGAALYRSISDGQGVLLEAWGAVPAPGEE